MPVKTIIEKIYTAIDTEKDNNMVDRFFNSILLTISFITVICMTTKNKSVSESG
jgi:hypothetical protein